jgi:hypothetical protein
VTVFMPAILATWEAQEAYGSRLAWANSSWDPTSKITRARWTGGVAKWWSFWFASMKTWVQTQVPPKKKKKNSWIPLQTVFQLRNLATIMKLGY